MNDIPLSFAGVAAESWGSEEVKGGVRPPTLGFPSREELGT